MSGRVDAMAGDFQRASLPASFDRAVLANVLHLEDEAGAAALVEKAAPAVVLGGDVVIVDVLDCLTQDLAHAAYGLHLAMRTNGGVAHRSAKLEAWLATAGFRRLKIVDLSSELPALGAIVAER